MRAAALRLFGRLRVRLLVVNLVLLLVPIAGLEFARVHERQLLEALERDMRDQAALVRASLEADLERGIALDDDAHREVLIAAARETRTRIRILDADGDVLVDSHEDGPPEGPEPPPPSLWPSRARIVSQSVREALRGGQTWPDIPERGEVKSALAGKPGAFTRIRGKSPGVLLFISEPILQADHVAGVVYAARSTQPVLVELYRIRAGLFRVLAVAVALTLLVTLLLAWSITTPIEKLSRAAKRVSAGEPGVVVPISGGAETRELGEAFAAMKDRLDARLRYIEGFAADVAHEFKSPLTSIRGAAELLGEGAADDPEARSRFLRNIELDVARLDRLVSRLLELSRIEASSEPVLPVDLAALARKVAARSATPDQRVVVTATSRRREVHARETDLETALVNLVDNAVRFSPPGAVVDVTIEDRGPAVAVVVADRGPGVAEEHRARIFDRFFTTDAERDGTGLGLAIARAVARAHGGDLTLASEPNQGARFTLSLPALGS